MNSSTLTVFIISLLLSINSCASFKRSLPIKNAHAHNDYEHSKPLFDALENHFISVEADIHLINNELYVSHDPPKELDPSKTLEALYLKPLQNEIKHNKGRVYLGNEDFFYLMIDIKSEAESTYIKLKQILKNYEDIICVVRNGKEEGNKPIKIVVTGIKGRPFDQILADEPKCVSIDGRFNELGRRIPSDVMPFISENYKKFLSYSGEGNPSIDDTNILIKMVEATHNEGKKLRFWASPDNKSVWKFLIDNHVDFVNTDSLVQFKTYMLNKKK